MQSLFIWIVIQNKFFFLIFSDNIDAYIILYILYIYNYILMNKTEIKQTLILLTIIGIHVRKVEKCSRHDPFYRALVSRIVLQKKRVLRACKMLHKLN